MYNLESTIGRLRNLHSTICYILSGEQILVDTDFPNAFGDLNLDSFYPAVNMQDEYRNEFDHYDDLYYSFPETLNQKLKQFVQCFANYNKASELLYEEREYWIKLGKLNEWCKLKDSAEEILNHLEAYLDDLGICYTKK